MHQRKPEHGVVQPGLDKHHGQRQREERQRECPRQKDQQPEQFLAAEVKARQRIARRGPDDDGHDHRHPRYQDRVLQCRQHPGEPGKELQRAEVEFRDERLGKAVDRIRGRQGVDQQKIDRQQHPGA